MCVLRVYINRTSKYIYIYIYIIWGVGASGGLGRSDFRFFLTFDSKLFQCEFGQRFKLGVVRLYFISVDPVHCSWDLQVRNLAKSILKLGPTILFTHLKIILLQCFQFSIISGIQTDSQCMFAQHFCPCVCIFFLVSCTVDRPTCTEKYVCNFKTGSQSTIHSLKFILLQYFQP